jgi:hypothetical protein
MGSDQTLILAAPTFRFFSAFEAKSTALCLATGRPVCLLCCALHAGAPVQPAAELFAEFLDVVGRLLLVFPASELPPLREQEFSLPVQC